MAGASVAARLRLAPLRCSRRQSNAMFDGICDHPRCRREHAALIPLATECLMQKTSYIALVMIAAATSAGAQRASIVDDAGTLHLPDGEKIPYSDLASDQARRNFIDVTRGYRSEEHTS